MPNSYVPTAAQRAAAEEWQDNPPLAASVDAGPIPTVCSRPTWRCSRTLTHRRGPWATRCRCTVATRPRPARRLPGTISPAMPNYAWPSYAAYPNYAAVTYPKQYSPTAWPYIGPFYPYPQVPLGWRKVTLEWSDGWWFLDFKDSPASCWKR